jgi:hypothetical protein
MLLKYLIILTSTDRMLGWASGGLPFVRTGMRMGHHARHAQAGHGERLPNGGYSADAANVETKCRGWQHVSGPRNR